MSKHAPRPLCALRNSQLWGPGVSELYGGRPRGRRGRQAGVSHDALFSFARVLLRILFRNLFATNLSEALMC